MAIDIVRASGGVPVFAHPGADARGLEPEAVPLSGAAGTESSQPHGTDNGSEGGCSSGTHQSRGWV